MDGIIREPYIIYGPFFSRRLGRSLGINVFNASMKVCSFDCVYCEIGETLRPTLEAELTHCYEVEEILDAVERACNKPRSIHVLTLSGQGEPTLHPHFFEIVEGIRQIMNLMRPDAQLALLTNGTKSELESIQAAYRLIDQVMIKLDAGDPETFLKLNKPVYGFGFTDLIEGLRQARGLTLQSCMIEGDICNAHGKPYAYWVDMVRNIQPQEVQVYTIERPTRDEKVRKVAPVRLLEIEEDLLDDGINARAFWR